MIDTAYVEIRPLFTGLAASTQAGIRTQLAGVDLAGIGNLNAGLTGLAASNERVVLTGEQAAAAFSAQGAAATRSGAAISTAANQSAVTVESAAAAKIAATVRERAELTLLAAEYARVAAASTVSSEAQIAAANLAAAANARLAATGAATATAAAAGTQAGAAFAGGMSKGMKGLIGLTVGVLGIQAIAGGLEEATAAAGDLEKAQQTVRAVYGDSADEVLRFTENARGMNVNIKDAEQVAARIGILAKNLGIGAPLAANMAIELQTLGASVAAVRGGDPDKMLAKLPLVLAGNTRAIKEWGFSFSTAQIQQEAVTRGAAKQGATLTPAAKAIGIYGLLVRQLGFFQSEAAKHSDDLVNQEQRLAAVHDDLNESLGGLVKGPLASFKGGIADAEEGILVWLASLKENEALAQSASGVIDALGTGFKIVGDIFADNKETIKLFFDNMIEGLRMTLVVAKPVIIALGVGLVIALKAAFVGMKLLATATHIVQEAFKVTAGIVIGAIDKFLGGLSLLTDALSHVPFIGDKFAGVSDAINVAREELREFSSDLRGLDDRHVNITFDVAVVLPPGLTGPIADAISGTSKPATGKQPPKSVLDGGPAGPGNEALFVPSVNVPPAIAAVEQRLQDNLRMAQAMDDGIANDKAALAKLITFYDQQANNDKLSRAVRRAFAVKRAEARAEVRRLDAQEAQDASDAADAAEKAAKDKADAAVAERRAVLEASIRIAATTRETLVDDINAEEAYIAFLRHRVNIAKRGSAARKAAQAELQAEENVLADLQGQKRDKVLVSRESLLRDNLTLAQFTKPLADDKRALRALEKFYAARVAAAKKGSAARRRWRIELERTRAEIREIEEEQKKTSDAESNLVKQQQFAFLNTQHGFAANLASNLLSNVSGLVGGTGSSSSAAAGATARPDFADLPPGVAPPLPSSSSTSAEATRETGRAPTSSQLETLIQLTRSTLTELKLMRGGTAHPEARGNRRSQHHATETSPA